MTQKDIATPDWSRLGSNANEGVSTPPRDLKQVYRNQMQFSIITKTAHSR